MAMTFVTNVVALDTADDNSGRRAILMETHDYKFGFLMGNSGTNHGIYDYHKNGTGAADWVLKAEADNVWTLTGNVTGDAGTVNGKTVASNVPSGAIFTDENVKQGETTTPNWRKILLAYQYDAGDPTAAISATTNQVYACVGISAQPSTGKLRATSYNVSDNCTLQWNSTDESLDFVF